MNENFDKKLIDNITVKIKKSSFCFNKSNFFLNKYEKMNNIFPISINCGFGLDRKKIKHGVLMTDKSKK